MSETKITVLDNGPYRIEGEGLAVCDGSGRVYGLGGRTVLALCRCGHSQNKPFCDGSHNGQSFQSVCQATELPPAKPKA